MLNLTFYGKDRHRGDSLTSKCKECRNKQNREYFVKNPQMREKHNTSNKEKRKHYYQDPVRKQKYKNLHLKYKYGLSLESYNKMLDEQNNTCKICKKEERCKNNQFNGKLSMLAVDHCHKTGKVRGLLCATCNKALGAFNDDIEIMSNAIRYLQENK